MAPNDNLYLVDVEGVSLRFPDQNVIELLIGHCTLLNSCLM